MDQVEKVDETKAREMLFELKTEHEKIYGVPYQRSIKWLSIFLMFIGLVGVSSFSLSYFTEAATANLTLAKYIYVVTFSSAIFVIGLFLKLNKKFIRIPAILIFVLFLFVIPVGTIIGGYGIYVLIKGKNNFR